jgi:geranylgeranyl diphosphate synthase, type I
MDIESFRERFQPYLDEFITQKNRNYDGYTRDPVLASVLDYPRQLVAGTGKRIRPYAAYSMFRALNGGDSEDTLRLLVALELFHLFCLVHDDVIDRGTERYSMPTLHRYVAGELSVQKRLSNHEHIGNSQAILLGDLLFAWAHEAFYSNSGFSRRAIAEAQRFFVLMIDEVVIGQMLDVDMMTRRDTSLDIIQQKTLLKTASYTFIRPLQIGAALAERSAECEEFCYELGLGLGMAFQTQDDLLDLIGTPATTRKTLFSDLRENQHTFFTQYILEHGSQTERETLRQLLGADLQPQDRERVIDLFQSSGAIDHGRATIEGYLDRACHAIDTAPVQIADKQAFYALAGYIRGRVPPVPAPL